MLLGLYHFYAAYQEHCHVIQDKPGIKLLNDKPTKAGVEIVESNIVFQIPEGGFYPPYADILEMPIIKTLKSHA